MRPPNRASNEPRADHTNNRPTLTLGSLRAHGPRTITTKDGTIIQARAGDGTPIPFKADTRTGISDHLPLIAELDL